MGQSRPWRRGGWRVPPSREWSGRRRPKTISLPQATAALVVTLTGRGGGGAKPPIAQSVRRTRLAFRLRKRPAPGVRQRPPTAAVTRGCGPAVASIECPRKPIFGHGGLRLGLRNRRSHCRRAVRSRQEQSAAGASLSQGTDTTAITPAPCHGCARSRYLVMAGAHGVFALGNSLLWRSPWHGSVVS